MSHPHPDLADLDFDALLSDLDPDSAPQSRPPSPTAVPADRSRGEERRAARRWDRSELSGEIRLTIPGVANIQIVNISATGVLIETSHPLKPGTTANLFVRLNGTRHAVRAVTVRSALHTITAKSEIVYRTALCFDTPLPLDAERP